MITITKQENGVLFTFQDSDKYLYGSGTIEVPFNSLSIIQDESDMITLRKSASNDIFLSARYDTDLGYSSKEEAVNALKGMLYDEAGISEEEVQDMIDAATSGMPSSQVVEQLRTDVNTVSGTVSSHIANTTVHFTGTQKSNYDGLEGQYHIDDSWNIMPQSAFNDFANDYSTAMGQFDQRISANASAVTELKSTKLDASAYTPTDLSQYWTSAQTQSAIDGVNNVLTAHTANTTVHVTSLEKGVWNAKVDTSAITTSITSGSTDSEIPTAKATYDAIQAGGGGMDDDTQQLISTAFNDLNDRKADLTELSKYQKKGDYVKTSTLADYMTNDAFDEYATAKERIISGALNDLNDKFGGIRLVKISQAEYDALSTKDSSTLYIISD